MNLSALMPQNNKGLTSYAAIDELLFKQPR